MVVVWLRDGGDSKKEEDDFTHSYHDCYHL